MNLDVQCIMCLGCNPIGIIHTQIDQGPISKIKPMPGGSIEGILNENLVINLLSITCLKDKCDSETEPGN